MGAAAERRRASAGSTSPPPAPSTASPWSARSPATTWIRTSSPSRAPGCWPSTWNTPGRAGCRSAASGEGTELARSRRTWRPGWPSCGITLVPQYGVGGYRVDFAATHPDDPSQMILAVEADGAVYRHSGSVRDRDRLRKRAPGTARLAAPPALVHQLVPATPRPSSPSSRPPTPKRSGPTPRPRHPRRLCPTTRHWPTNPYLPTTRRRPPTSWHPRPTLFPTAPRWLRAPQRPRQLVRQASPTRGVSTGRHGSPVLDPRRAPIALPAGDPASARGLPAANG